MPPGLLAGAFALSLAIAQDRAAWPPPAPDAAKGKPPGLIGPVGPQGEPKVVTRLDVRRRGVFENYLIDTKFGGRDAVKIKAAGAVLRNSEVRNATNDGIEVYADDVLIENCRIHHILNGTFKDQKDAHGITGRANRLVIRNCEIYYVSGDAVQFDPDRDPWTDVLIENCVFWTGPLPADAAGFRKGERPGENAVDTKQLASNPRSRLVIRNSVCHGWRQPGQISLMAALNIKNHVDVRIENCVFYDNEVCFRLRGNTGKYGGARVEAVDCRFYSSEVAVRAEDGLENLRLLNSAYGKGIGIRFRAVSGKPRGLSIKG